MDKIVLYFVVGSFVGWLMEVFFKTISRESLDRAGMGKGPFCMAYGIGVVLLYTLVANRSSNLIIVFLLSSFIGTVFEYFTALVLKKVYGLVLWEYTKLKFAINDHICLEFMFLWGVFGSIFCKVVVPFLNNLSTKIITESTIPLLYAVALYIMSDYAISGYIVIRNKKRNIKSLERSH